MTIAFLAPALLPEGSSGVGDYTLRLARASSNKGVTSAFVEWNSNPTVQTGSPPGDLTILRLDPSNTNAKAIQQWMDKFEPDWLSLQFSGYGFHPRGLAYGLTQTLCSLNRRPKLHIMFHEVWIGLEANASWKDRVIGKIQAHSIQQLVRKLEPSLITTSNTAYQKALQIAGINSQLSPLPSNIPVVDHSTAKIRGDLLGGESSWGLFFGTIHPNIELADTISLLKEINRQLPTEFRLCHVGNLPRNREDLLKRLSEGAGLKSGPLFLGPQPPEVVSVLHHLATFGISTNPPMLWGKSGTIATALEHDLPILAVARPWRLRQDPTLCPTLPERIFTLDAEPAQFLSALAQPRNPIYDRTENVATEFLRLLEEASLRSTVDAVHQ